MLRYNKSNKTGILFTLFLFVYVHVHVSQNGRFHGCKYSQFFIQVNQVPPDLQDNQEHQEQEVIILRVTTITTGQ